MCPSVGYLTTTTTTNEDDDDEATTYGVAYVYTGLHDSDFSTLPQPATTDPRGAEEHLLAPVGTRKLQAAAGLHDFLFWGAGTRNNAQPSEATTETS